MSSRHKQNVVKLYTKLGKHHTNFYTHKNEFTVHTQKTEAASPFKIIHKEGNSGVTRTKINC